MEKESPVLGKLAADLKLIKEAVSKSDSLIRFIDAGGALRAVLLASGLLIALFSTVFYYLLERHGSFEAIPVNLRVLMFVLIGFSSLAVVYLKSRNFLRSARKIGSEMTYYKLLKEVFKPRYLALLLPNMAAITLVIIFLGSRGYGIYIIPIFAVLYGLMIISLSSLWFLKGFYFFGLWLTAAGLLTLFTAATIHPLASLGITFASGAILASLLLYFKPHGEKR